MNYTYEDLVLTETPEKLEKGSTKKKTNITYETAYVSGDSFAVRKKTTRTSELAVFLLSKNQFYIKKENTGEIKQMTPESLNTFLRYSDGGIRLNKDSDSPLWIEVLPSYKEGCVTLFNFLRDTNCVELAKKGYLYCCANINYPLDELYKTIKIVEPALKSLGYNLKDYRMAITKACCRHHSYFTFISSDTLSRFNDDFISRKIEGVIRGIFELHRTSSISHIRSDSYHIPPNYTNIGCLANMIRHYIESPLTLFTCSQKAALLNQFTFDPKRFNEYVFESAAEQGFADSLPSFCVSWMDYLRIQESLYGKIVDKYPKNLLSEERRLSYELSQQEELAQIKGCEEIGERLKKYEDENSKYIIKAPKTPAEIIEESRNQANCLANYIKRYASGETMIFFLRKKEEPQKSFVTIEVRKDGSLGQVLGSFNKQPSLSVRGYVQDWHTKHFTEKKVAL